MTKRPNILFILTDDQGAWAMHCSGNSEIETPNLDRIAAEGIRFENFFCVSPVCSPARASIYTGTIPSRHGVHDWLAKGHVSEDRLDDGLREMIHRDDPPYEYLWPQNQLKGDEGIRYLDAHKTFTETLAESGYTCGLSGKWHIGDSAMPQAGFTYWHTEAMGGDNYFYPVVFENGKMTMKRDVYVTDYIANNALDFIRGHCRDEAPFFLSVNFTAPHSPWAAECHPAAYIDRYKDCPFDSIPDLPPHPWVAGADQTREEWDRKPHPGVRFIHAKYAPIREEWEAYRRESLTGYFAAVTAMDHAVGCLLDELDRLGIAEDTMVVFTSDNGSNMGHHGIFGKGNGTNPQNMYDTSVKVPGLFRFPGRIPAGRVSEELVSHYDLYDTILELAGVPHEPDPARPGQSFAGLLTGETDRFRDEVVVFDEYGPVRMIRTKEWKYVHRYPDGPDELYDLVNDSDEYTNRIDDPSETGRVREMRRRLENWFDRYVDPELDGSKTDCCGKGQLDSHHFIR
ncbi:MAG: sulfatase-like hydrolase/transferase [Firmicutes bacterium]|nr:sulfatase-like hydrolase/transferase [Bacillota bacterium]